MNRGAVILACSIAWNKKKKRMYFLMKNELSIAYICYKVSRMFLETLSTDKQVADDVEVICGSMFSGKQKS